MKLLAVASLVILLSALAECSKILVIFHAASKSHTILGKQLADGLLDRGHHITMVTPYKQTPRDNFTLIELKSMLEWKKKSDAAAPPTSPLAVPQNLMNMAESGIEIFFSHPDIQKIIKEKTKFDLVLMCHFFNEAFFGLAHHLEAPLILFGNAGSNSIINSLMANPNPIYMRSFFGSNSPTFLGRLSRVVANMAYTVFNSLYLEKIQEATLQKYIPNSPSLEELKKTLSLVLLNAHISIESPTPNLPNVINIGGYHISDPKPLPGDMKTFLDGAKEGAILLSFGSNIKIGAIEKEKMNAVLKVMGELAPIRIIMKSELKHENLPKNIMVSNWLPQTDVLAHPNIKVFISHMGLGGVTEGVFYGVPMLGMPFFADQHINAEDAAKKGYAIHLKMSDLTEENFRTSLKELLHNPKYRKEIGRRSGLMRNQPVKPLDNAMFWIEHIIEYGGGSHLQNEGVNMPWYQLHLVDIYIFFTVLLLSFLLISFYVTKYSIRLVKWLVQKKKSCCDGKNKVKKS